MKSIHEQIHVDVRPGGRVPRQFRWGGRTYRVRRLLDYWILQTRWWGREEKRIYYRLETHRGIVEIYRAAERRADRPSECADTALSDPSETHFPRSNAYPSLSSVPSSPSSEAAPLPIEGDTHTRERRLTDAAYRPDVRIEQAARRRATSSDRHHRVRWMLSKIVD